jgi:hypothetical protein
LSKREHEVVVKAALSAPPAGALRMFVRAGTFLWNFRTGAMDVFWSRRAQPIADGGLLPRFPERWRYMRVEYLLGMLAVAALSGCNDAAKPVVFDYDCQRCAPGTYCPQSCVEVPR